MQNKTPIVVLIGLAIVVAAAVAWLARGQWMALKTETVATAPAPEAPKAPAQPATTTAEATQPAATGAATSGQAASTTAPAATGQPATAAPATPATPEQPATDTAGTAAQPDSMAAATTEQPATEAPKNASTGQQTAATQPEAQPEQPAAGAAAAAKVPAFDTVRVEKTGEAVIAGTAAPGADVVVKLDGKVIGETTANSDGAFVVVPTAPLPAGSGALTLESKAPGAAEATVSQQSVAVIVPATGTPREALVALVSPNQPTRVLQKPEPKQDAAAPETPEPKQDAAAPETPAKLVSIDAVDYDPAGNIVFSGQGNAGNTARVYIDNNFLGDAPVGTDGHWTFSATAQVTPGVHTLRVDGLDSAGKVLNRVEVPFVREEQKKVADANQQQAQSGSSTKTDSENTQQPATQQQAANTPVKPKDGRVVIQPGNNLWTIARVLYGSGAKFTMLYEANKDQIRDPDRIYPGQIFKTPDVAAKLESIDPKRRAPLKPEENAVTDQ
ncbi:MAG: LysM peptidoglycan-binding domain-containing protein [Aestuariivirga sp.]|uniref:Ig-like domain-containing protein n=1 Tax=Aestuariivirga sp. TaxID=2650926 RepID=UPI0025B89987|nr:Ig-like domain-containing protein [Aestuariivirga sp.]MCA3559713.1 LysM peptidoglycan-binding domain-containing protein [Aestuariivirga sp.]